MSRTLFPWWRALLAVLLLSAATATAGQTPDVTIWFDLNDNLARYDASTPPPQGIYLRVVRRPATEVHVAVLTPTSAASLQAYTSKLAATPKTDSPITHFYHYPQAPDVSVQSIAPMSPGCSGYNYPTVTVNVVYNGSVVGTHWATFWSSYISGRCAMWAEQGHDLTLGPGGECEQWEDVGSTDGWYDYEFHETYCYLDEDYSSANWTRTSTYPTPRGYASFYMDMLSNKTGVEFESTISGYPYYE